jgi:hypothetical protein
MHRSSPPERKGHSAFRVLVGASPDTPPSSRCGLAAKSSLGQVGRGVISMSDLSGLAEATGGGQ